MGKDILAIDIGTTGFKLGVYSRDLEQRCQVVRPYEVNMHDRVKAEIDPEKWWDALRASCADMGDRLSQVGVISLSVTTPGLLPMDAEGQPLGPAILFFDARSHDQAREIRSLLGESYFLDRACNLPVSGGSSLCSIMWIRDEQPAVFEATSIFGHTNTFIVKRLTGKWAIDQTTTSITGLYNTREDDLTWNREVLDAIGLSDKKLPPLLRAHDVAGTILPDVADELGLPRDVEVLVGGNDAVLAALFGGVTESGQIICTIGTAEITHVCVDKPLASRNFNVRCHAVPGRWLTFFVLNAGGKAFEWFHKVFCSEMGSDEFYGAYLPAVLKSFLTDEAVDVQESHLPTYVPFLGGSRYSTEIESASFTGLDLETSRDEMLLSLVRGNARYSGSHLDEIGHMTTLDDRVVAAGSASRIHWLMEARRRWFGNYDFEYRDQSSLHGAAVLARMHLDEQNGIRPVVPGALHPTFMNGRH